MLLRVGKVLLVLAVLCGASQMAIADESESQARMHYAAGKVLYNLGNYNDALRELLVGYSLIPKPQFLLNIGQCYRRLDDPLKAKEMYVKYLQDTPPDDPSRAEVSQLIVDLDKQLASRVVSRPPPVVDAGPVVLVAPEATIVVKKRRPYWAIPVAIIGAAGLSVGLYFALRPSCSASIGCVNAGGN